MVKYGNFWGFFSYNVSSLDQRLFTSNKRSTYQNRSCFKSISFHYINTDVLLVSKHQLYFTVPFSEHDYFCNFFIFLFLFFFNIFFEVFGLWCPNHESTLHLVLHKAVNKSRGDPSVRFCSSSPQHSERKFIFNMRRDQITLKDDI